MRVFLDIDGVLLLRGGALAPGAGAFLDWAVRTHQPCWLSTRTRDGARDGAYRAFSGLLEDALIDRIPAVAWRTLKTDALALGRADWVWVDDAPLWHERSALAAADATHRLLLTRSDREPGALDALPRRIEAAVREGGADG